MLSMPPATIPSASPSWMAWAASTTAFSPEPQALFTVKLGTSFGTPPSSAATRPGFNPRPAGSTWPRITSSTCAGSRPARALAPRTPTPPRLVARPRSHAPPPGPAAGRGRVGIGRRAEVRGVYRVGGGDVGGNPLLLLGSAGRRTRPAGGAIPERLTGLLDTLPLERLVRESIPWDDLRRHVDAGEVDAVAVAATEISSGKSVVWVDNREGAVRRWARDPFVIARPARLGPGHALASAAIPFLFPAPRIDGAYYCDGRLRLDTPLAPALRPGAHRLLILRLRHMPTPAEEAALAAHREANCSSLAYLAGKVLNALLLDHVDYDVDRLRLVNAILDTGARAYGPDFLRRINQVIEQMRGTPYRVVRDVYVLPSRDLSVMAAECLEAHRGGAGRRGGVSDAALRYTVRGIAGEADLLSYLYFDHCYAEHLIELGRADAEARADELVTFFRDDG